MTAYVIDAYAWVEYFEGSSPGSKVRAIVEDEAQEIVTSAVTIAELSSKFARRGVDFSHARDVLLSLSRVQGVDAAFAADAGTLHAELRRERKHIGLADAFVLLTARKLRATVVTGDQDFKGLKDVLFLR